MDKGQDMEEKKKWVSSLYMDRLRCNGMINPLGISGECLLFQWIIAGRGENILQYCCRLQEMCIRDRLLRGGGAFSYYFPEGRGDSGLDSDTMPE